MYILDTVLYLIIKVIIILILILPGSIFYFLVTMPVGLGSVFGSFLIAPNLAPLIILFLLAGLFIFVNPLIPIIFYGLYNNIIINKRYPGSIPKKFIMYFLNFFKINGIISFFKKSEFELIDSYSY